MTTRAPRSVGEDAAFSDIDVAISDQVEDVDDALRIVHDGFVEAGYVDPQPSGRRIHHSYLNPGTTFFVARINGEPVGACAFIADGPFGLPSDRAFAEENDALRAGTSDLVREIGSLVVRSAHRRSTRRIVMRLFAALVRLSIDEFPAAPLTMAVAPENERFYESLCATQRLAGSRPLYGAPAMLLLTGGGLAADHCAQRATPSHRRIDALVAEPNPSWLTDRRSHLPPPADWLEALIDEQGVTEALIAQIELLSARYPQVLERVLRRSRVSAVA